MYVHYAERRGWKVETLEADETGIGGMKSVNFMVTGAGAYSVLKYESGVHRVQRVPETESQGRIQTSTCSVAVMPEAEDVEVHIDDKDIRIDVMRASGNGGQCVNTTDSAVRLTHYPTGIVIYSQTEKSQIQNKEKAFALLRTKLYDLELQKKQDAESEERRSQIGTGDRSEKIRTYNFPQGRVTDHRINLTLYKLDKILDGDIQEIIDACIAADQAKKLQKETEENYKKIAQEQARYSNSHHSWNYYWGGFNQEEISRLSQQIGRNWNGDIWSLSPEEMKVLRSNVDMWEKIQNTGKGGYGERLTDKLNDYVEQAGKLEELTDKLYEGLTGITFDGMFDSFVNNLMDMKYEAKDAAEDIAEYFMRAMPVSYTHLRAHET